MPTSTYAGIQPNAASTLYATYTPTASQTGAIYFLGQFIFLTNDPFPTS